MIRSISVIGNLWPLCKTCKHVAQEHDDDGCKMEHIGKCPTCNTHGVSIRCDCEGYHGPTWEEFKKLLTPEEIAYYHWELKRD
jgi:hypothetical protein